MTQRFDEGVKEILLALTALGATTYSAAKIKDLIDKRPEPIEQKVVGLKKAIDEVDNVRFDNAAKEVLDNIQTPLLVKPKKSYPQSQIAKSEKVEHIIYRKLRNGGLSRIAAAGIIGNLKAESNLDPRLKQERGGPGRGIAQWEKGGRFDTDNVNLLDFAETHGTPWHDLNTQIDFILHELDKHPEYKRVKSQLNAAKNVEDATLIFLTKYEKAGIPHTGNRIKYAKEFLQQI